MINRVVLRGFQSHVDSDIMLAPGLNVVTGPTDSGKTAFIRAIRWVAFNDPQGEVFVHAAVGEAIVEVYMEDGSIITKRRNKGKTSYSLCRPGLADMNFNKAEIPDEVRQALGIEKQAYGDYETALNFAFQLEAPFLISEPPSAGAKVLGKLAGTEVVDMAIKSVAKENYQHQQDRLTAKKDIERLEIDLQGYADLDQLKAALGAAEYLLQQADKASSQAANLVQLRSIYQATEFNLHVIAQRLDKLAIVPDLEVDLQNIEKTQQRYDTLLGLYAQLGRLESTLAGLLEEEKKYTGLAAADTMLNSVDDNYQQLASLTKLSTLYLSYAQEASRLENILKATQELDVVAEALRQVEAAAAKVAILTEARDQYAKLSAAVASFDKVISVTDNVEQASKLLAGIEVKRQRVVQLQDLKAVYDVKQRTLAQAMTDERSAGIMVTSCQQELADIWASLKVCPLCEKPVEGAK